MKVAALFLWLVVPATVWGVVVLFGTPHAVVAYTFYDNGDPYNPRAHRTYIDCTYVGWTGARKVAAQNGKCPWVRVFKERL